MGLLGKAGKRIAEEALGSAAFWDDRLTPFQNKVVELAKNGMRNRAIADEMMSSPDSINATLSKMRTLYGLDIPFSAHPSDEQDYLIKLFKKGLTNADIVGRSGKTLTNVKTVRSKFNATQPEGKRWNGYGVRYALPLVGGGLLGRLMLDDSQEG